MDFPVVGPDGALVGILTRANLIAGLTDHGSEAFVASAMDRHFVTAHPAEMLDVTMGRLQECACGTIPVVSDGTVVGMLTTDNIGELMMVRDALRSSTPRRPILKLAA